MLASRLERAYDFSATQEVCLLVITPADFQPVFFLE